MRDKKSDPAEILKDYIEGHYKVKFDGKKLSDKTNLVERMVIDSFGMIQLIIFIETKFKISLNEKDLASSSFATVQRMAAVIKNRRA